MSELATYGERKLRVPHVVAWSSEDTNVVRACPYAEAPAVFTNGRQGRGTPVWGELHPERQRRAMWTMRCQICDTQLRPATGRLVLWDAIQRDDLGRPVCQEPWICDGCVQYALAVCPGLQAREGLRVLHSPVVLMLATTVRLPDGREAISYIKALVVTEES